MSSIVNTLDLHQMNKNAFTIDLFDGGVGEKFPVQWNVVGLIISIILNVQHKAKINETNPIPFYFNLYSNGLIQMIHWQHQQQQK